MSEQKILRRKIELKKQGRDLIKKEIIDLKIRLTLVVLKERLESQIGKGNDSVMSRKLDCVNFLLEN